MAGFDPKSEGFEAERRTFENEALGVTIRLAKHQMSVGRTDQAVKWVEHAIFIDPLQEISHRRVIQG